MLFPHSRAALGPLVAQHDHRAGGDLIVLNGLAGILHIIKHPRFARKLIHHRLYPGFFHHSAIRCQISVQDGQPALGLFGLLQREDHIVLHQRHLCQVFQHGFAGHRPLRGVQLGRNGLQHGLHAAMRMKYLHRVFARGLDVAQIRHLAADTVKILQSQLRPGFVGNAHQVQHRVGGSPHSHHSAHTVQQGGAGQDLAGGQPLGDHFHHTLAALLGIAAFFRSHRRGGGGVRQRQAQYLA